MPDPEPEASDPGAVADSLMQLYGVQAEHVVRDLIDDFLSQKDPARAGAWQSVLDAIQARQAQESHGPGRAAASDRRARP